MAQELVYTSVPRGLKPGSFGFCTAACSRTLNERAISLLERLSSYRRLAAEERDAGDPVVYSHLLVEDGGATRRVLSRIAPSGVDYSGRENTIACHMVLDAHDLVVAGPAAICAEPNFFAVKWDEGPKYFERSIVMPTLMDPRVRCDEWRRVTGDAGWAGVVASSAFSGQNVLLVVDPTIDVLRLYQESLALLPREKRWDVTFSTYYTKTIPGVRCQWKAVMKGSPEESSLRSIAGMVKFDLTDPKNLRSIEKMTRSVGVAKLVRDARGEAAPEPELETPRVANAPLETRSDERSRDTPATPQRLNETEQQVATPPVVRRKDKSPRKLDVERARGNSTEERGRGARRLALWARCAICAVVASTLAAFVVYFIMSSDGASPFDGLKKLLHYGQAVNELAKPEEPFNSRFFEGDLPEPNENDMFDDEAPDDMFQDDDEEPSVKSSAKPVAKPAPEKKTSTNDAKSKDNDSSEKKADAKPVEVKKDAEKKRENASTTKIAPKPESKTPKMFDETDDLAKQRPEATLNSLVKALNAGRADVNFKIFDEKKNEIGTLREDLVGEVSQLLQQAYPFIEKNKGSIAVTLDISNDKSERFKFANTPERKTTCKATLDPAAGSEKRITFELTGPEKKNKREFSIVIAGKGLLAMEASDAATRDYLLSCAKISWEFELNDGSKTYRSESRQLLKTQRFERDKELATGFLKDFVKAYGEKEYDVCSVETIEKTKKQCLLVVKRANDRSSNSFVEISKVEGSKLVFTFSLKMDNDKSIPFMELAFSGKSKSLKIEKSYDKAGVYKKLKDYYEDEEKRKLGSSKPTSRDDKAGIEERVETKINGALQQIKRFVESDRGFQFYFVVRDKDMNIPPEKNRIALGETTIGAGMHSELRGGGGF